MGSPAPEVWANRVWAAFAVLVALIAADNLLWRVACWIANPTFVAVTGDLRRELFCHLTGQAPGYFADRLPGTLASRVTATSNAVFTVENMAVLNVLPPIAATITAIAFVATVSTSMALVLMLVAGAMVIGLFRLAAAGQPLHHDFADKAAAVDGEMVDVISNMPLVWAFCGLRGERRRFDVTIDREMTARRRSLFYLERLRILHASITIILTIGLLAWAIRLWEQGAVTTGDVVMACTLGLSVLHATRDLAVALVDVTQHVARLSEALLTLLVPHQLRDHPEAQSFVHRGASVALENISFSYPDGTRVFGDLSLRIEPGQRVGLVGPSGGGKSSLFALIQRFYDLRAGRIVIDGQDIRAGDTGEPAVGHRRRAAGSLAVSPLRHGQHPIWQAGRNRRRGPRSRRLRQLPRLHRSSAAGLFDHRRRSWRETVGRSAPAHRHRARVSQGCASAAPRRGDVGARR